jgi:hypothetical protein
MLTNVIQHITSQVPILVYILDSDLNGVDKQSTWGIGGKQFALHQLLLVRVSRIGE